MLNIKQFIFFLVAASSVTVYGGGNNALPTQSIYDAIDNHVDFNCLTPGQTGFYLLKVNGEEDDHEEEYQKPVDRAMEKNNRSAVDWLIKQGARLRRTTVLKKALDAHEIDYELVAFLLEHGACHPVSINMWLEYNSDKSSLEHFIAKNPSVYAKTAFPDKYSTKKGTQVIALLQRFELFSPVRAAWMGAVYKGCLAREGRAAGAGAGSSSGPVLSSGRVELVE